MIRDCSAWFQEIIDSVPPQIKEKGNLTFAIADRIVALMEKKGLNKKQLAEAMGKRPSMVTEWIGGQHNFTIRTIAELTVFFGEPIITVVT